MMSRQRVFRAALVALMMVALGAGSALAEKIYFATIDGPSAGNTSPGAGTATLTLNNTETEVSYVIEYSGLQGVEFIAHFHSAKPGESGPVLTALPVGSPKNGVWLVGPPEVVALNEGRVYVNIHTDLYPAGEIRGDIAFQTVPNTAMSFGAVKALFQ